MEDSKLYPINTETARRTHLSTEQYQAMYQQSIDDPQKFWAEQANKFITWFSPWTQVLQGDFHDLDMQWFVDGKLNACYNCVDRHLKTRKDHIAIIWEGNNPDENQTLTYSQLHEKICKLANVLKAQGIQKNDRICIYLPMIPEAVIAMLACARIGAVHSVVFGGFSADGLKARILDANCKLLITADGGFRGKKTIAFKQNCDEALVECPQVQHMIVIQHTGESVRWDNTRDIWYHKAMQNASANCPVEPMDANDPLFILYTSGSTGKPKGVLHSTGGYLVYAAITHYYIFDYQDNDIYWCTADVGWITGHTYTVYGPLANGATTVLFEGIPNYPTFARYWEIIDKHHINIFYTAPTALRALRREGDRWVTQTKRRSLTLLGSVGEPINPDVWQWYYEVVGQKRCPIVNTWWQTETGGILLSPLPGATPLAAGSAGWPFFGIIPEIIDEKGKIIQDDKTGRLVIKQPWPGLMQTIYGNRNRFIDTYFKEVPDYYLTGDGAHRDLKGYFWISGRSDDVIKVSGHRMGTEELESAFVSHPAVSEVAVVGVPHAIKGEGIFAFVTTKAESKPSEALKKELFNHIRKKIGPLATPEEIQWTASLPKTRSGKIMRRILRKIANNEFDELGDLSTLAEPNVVEKIIANKQEQK
jgi:acetyl-CoA synthetase